LQNPNKSATFIPPNQENLREFELPVLVLISSLAFCNPSGC
jgi:hypothetical protein